MRRWFMLFVIVLLVGCGGGAKPTATSAPSPTAAPTTASQTSATIAPTSGSTSVPPSAAVATTAVATTAIASGSVAAPTAAATKAPVATNGDLTQLHVGDNGDGYGFNVGGLSSDPAFRDKVYANVQGAGFNWVRQQVIWAAMEPRKGSYGNDTTAQLDQFVSGANAKGLKILLSVVKSPDWVGTKGGLPTKTQDFTDFMGFLTQRYKGKVQAYEIWNEENYAVETGGTVNVAAYPPVLKAGFQAVKKSDPKAVVVFGGMTPTGVNNPSIALNEVEYLRQIYALNGGEIKQYYDVLGAHPGSNCNDPDHSYPANPQGCDVSGTGKADFANDNSFYFQRIQDLRKVMVDAGEGQTKMWLTEFGWTTANQAKGYEYGTFVSEQQQAQYLVRAFQLGKSYPWMGVMFVWNLNFSTITQPNDEKYPWAVLNSDWSPRPAYTALKNMPK
ncbi:MAG: cellulase family glycosylhydrolase [Thermomicrobiales bacterium]